MTNSVWNQFRDGILLIVSPLVWAHEYCHYWIARQLGLLARIKGAKTCVHHVNLRQHILIAIAPTIPSSVIFYLSVIAYRNLAVTYAAGIYLGSITVIAFLLLISCAQDWWSIIHSIINPAVLTVDSKAMLIISKASSQEQDTIQSRIEALGYFIDWAQSDKQAITALHLNPFNLIVIDVDLTALNLSHIQREVSLHQKINSIRIFRLSSHDELSLLPTYLELGLPRNREISS